MMRLSKQQRVLLGALGLAVVVWVGDMLTGSGEPKTAEAAASTVAAAPQQTAEWHDLSADIARLTSGTYTSAAGELEPLQRDLFQPSPLMVEVFSPQESEEEEAQEAAAVVPLATSNPGDDFAARHVLSGVMLGSSPIAVIDDQLVPLKTTIEDYILIEINRDQVVFQHSTSDAQVVLEVRITP